MTCSGATAKTARNCDRPPVIVIAGPTASGKSSLAIFLAEAMDGHVINADSMQVYSDLRILTARPSAADEARVPHRLYGTIDPTTRYSAGRWREAAVAEIEATYAEAKLPIVVGGTGFYLESLIKGLSPMPEVPLTASTNVDASYDQQGLFEEVQACDPASATRIGRNDRQRLIRALAVFQVTGTPLTNWQSLPAIKPPFETESLWLNPPREALYARCDDRLYQMLDAGALEEVQALMARNVDPSLPAMKALGVPELCAHLRGELSREEALAQAQQATRRFAKRQLTWFRNQFISSKRYDAQLSESLGQEILSFIRIGP
ncbi:MAG: tRNA (adenosine(37)-N6)-dimethylallyltransferase MiaA [Alphaproteobacteria bacterium]|jgi:tRNA dimethylallyltransferase